MTAGEVKCHSCSRRAFMRAAATAAVTAGSYGWQPALLGQASKAAIGDLLVRNRAPVNVPLKPEDVAVGRPLIAWPMDPASMTPRTGLNNRLVLVSLTPARLATAPVPRAAAGVMAYSAICTHSGCDVSDWDPKAETLVCPCHESTFDPYDAGAVVGGPAPRPLPHLGLGLDNGNLVIAALFSSTPGAEPA